jgi:hypothetical protein
MIHKTNNQLVLLDSVLEEYITNGSFGNKDVAFENFVTEQYFKDIDLSIDETKMGLVGDSRDGGIDGFYLFVNDELINSLDELENTNKITMDLYIFQYKNKDSIEESVINKFLVASDLLFQLDAEMEDLITRFSETLSEKIKSFHNIMMKVASRHPKITINYIHASKGDEKNIFGPKFTNSSYISKISQLQQKVVDNLWNGVDVKYEIVDAGRLLEMFRKIPVYSLELKLNENPIAIDYKEGNQRGYIASVNIGDYFRFLCDSEGNLRKYLFESNIRDYQNKTTVNGEIEISVSKRKEFDFWWLNNGVTILAEKGTLVGKTLHLDNIQIVNGLQTSHTIFNTLSKDKFDSDERSLLLKIIITDKKDTMDAIIKSTNSQNPVPLAYLRATDRVQREIEEYFLSEGFYYDRRKNYYKNQNKPRKQIISIMYLSQCLTAIVEKNPSKARSNPTILTKKEADYKRLFQESRPVGIYLKCVKIMQLTEKYLKEYTPSSPTETSIATYYAFHFARVLTSIILNTPKYNDKQLLSIDTEAITVEQLSETFMVLKRILEDFSINTKQSNLTYIAKQIPFSDFITERIPFSIPEKVKS